MRWATMAVTALIGVMGAASCASHSPAHTSADLPGDGIHKIKHIVVIMQENRSFDHYFGTYPGADGFPRTPDGDFAVCAPDPAKGGCQEPYHDTRDLNAGGPHGQANAAADVATGKMDGFIGQAEFGRRKGCIK